MRDAAARTSLSVAELETLIEDPSHLNLVAQPIVDLRRGCVAGYEMLSRFVLERPVPPDHVFAEATRHGLADRLEAAVIRRALVMSAGRPPDCFVSVNVDPRQLQAQVVMDALCAPASLAGVVIELTEHGEAHDLGAIRETLTHLRTRGAFTAIDDAGAGYSGLKQILELSPQFLKIDRDLVTQLHTNEAKRALVHMLGELAGKLDAWVIAEGIEEEAELAALCQIGVPLGQGWFLGRPAPPWCDLRNEALDVMGRRVSLPGVARRMGALVEPCPQVLDGPWPEGPMAVAVLPDRRPTAMRLRTAHGTVERRAHEISFVKRDTPLADAAQRAATRPDALRWDPLLCLDERGRLVGVVTLQRLVLALATPDGDAVKSGGTGRLSHPPPS